MRREIVIVLYHHIAEEKDALTSQIGGGTYPEVFERHARYFARNFDFISGDDLISGVLPRKPLLVTFDDAYRSVLDVAGPVLRNVNAPSLFFINPATVIDGTVPIDNVLSFAVEALGFERVLSVLALDPGSFAGVAPLITEAVSEMSQAEISETKERLCSSAGTTEAEIRRTSKLFLDAADIPVLSGLGIEVGNHSKSHTFLRSLKPDELNTEIVESQMTLERLSGLPVRHFSIPYGDRLDATPTVLDMARGSGHKAIFLVHGKSNCFPPEPDMFYRTSLRNESCEKLPLRLRVLPMMRSLRDWRW